MAKLVKQKNPAKLAAAKKANGKKQAVKKPAGKKRSVPLPAALGLPPAPVPKRIKRVEGRVLTPIEAPAGIDAGILDTLWTTVESRRIAGDVTQSHSARLLSRGTPKVAQKLGEEAVECVIEATLGNHRGTVLESADLLYHLIVLWVDAGIQPAEIWSELARRQGISGIAEKAARPAGLMRAAGTRKLP
ncbi:phosphoribosyl-ATP diphosphatase [Roseomonas hellenica]|uniref:Phosphoribosyl-ATP pyrophosphatase n=1 Tax=Plastoroseomonas hellenica TaxID=2687306 RepID=A0ABS5EXS6_9PROT|nr:phosphoribosyl-ATP diphosphatase [Plastoroseomonas hellenica]MBR0665086.1 phosphoribosyl-ATP diphosphatase [Plastoroseomonas hellenica]